MKNEKIIIISGPEFMKAVKTFFTEDELQKLGDKFKSLRYCKHLIKVEDIINKRKK